MSVSLGFGPKNPNKEGIGIGSPLLYPPKTPGQPPPTPNTTPWSRDAMMGQEQSKDRAWGKGREEVWG